MQRIEKQITVNVPAMVAYAQWTQFEDFPRFMDGVKEVRQLHERKLFWRAQILGQDVEWEAEIYEQIPDQRIAWRSLVGHPNAGAVYFAPLEADRCVITLALEYEPLGAAEKVADAFGALALKVEGDLLRFRDFIQDLGVPTGHWKGEIRDGEET